MVELGDVAGDVPAVVHDLGGGLGVVHVALHHVRAFDQQHARRADGERLERFGIDDRDRDARHGPADGAFLAVDFRTLRAARGDVDRDERRELGRAVAFDRADAEFLREGVAERDRQLLRAGDDDFERLEIVGVAALEVAAKEGRRGEQDRGLAGAGELADLLGVERRVVVGDADLQAAAGPRA